MRIETQRWGEDALVEVSIGGKRSDNLSDFESMYESVLSKAEGEPLYRQEGQLRTLLIDELKGYLEQIKPFVELD